MSQNERDRTQRMPPATAMPDDGDDALDSTRSNAERLLRAADDAITRALSADSERFLQATRQAGGE